MKAEKGQSHYKVDSLHRTSTPNTFAMKTRFDFPSQTAASQVWLSASKSGRYFRDNSIRFSLKKRPSKPFFPSHRSSFLFFCSVPFPHFVSFLAYQSHLLYLFHLTNRPGPTIRRIYKHVSVKLRWKTNCKTSEQMLRCHFVHMV